MPFNGSGSFQPLPPPTYPAVSGTLIKASDFNAVINDILAGLSNCVTKDNQTTVIGNMTFKGLRADNLYLDTNDGIVYDTVDDILRVLIAGVPEFTVTTADGPGRNDDATTSNGLVRLSQLQALVSPIGSILVSVDLTAPAGYLLIDGKTIGNASSGATARANADTQALFTKLWAYSATAVPIYTSTGAASTRGASAAADFAANKRLALFTPDGGAFLRMWASGQTVDPSRVVGTAQSAYAGSFVWRLLASDGDADVAPRKTVQAVEIQGVGVDVSGLPSDTWSATQTATVTAGDNRPYNLALPHYVRYAYT